MEVLAPAKVNLYLEVISKREDGFHEIETLFERISIFDKIKIDISQGPSRIRSNNPDIPFDDTSLIGKTVNGFKKLTGCKSKFDIYIEKHIPISAGLGGGSSDAAALLKAMNQLTGNPLNKEMLYGLGCKMGADVPFFLEETRFAIGRGKGEVLEKIEVDAEIHHLLIKPPFEISTKSAYERIKPLNLTKNEGIDTMFTTFLKENNLNLIGKNLHNDLQIIALRDFPVIKEIIQLLEKTGSKGTIVSGSGPTIFGVFNKQDVEDAERRIKKDLSGQGWEIFAAHTY